MIFVVFRRLLQMGVYNAELFNNLGLCCFYAQQYDMTLTCFERALSLADENTVAEIWFNIGHVAMVSFSVPYKKVVCYYLHLLTCREYFYWKIIRWWQKHFENLLKKIQEKIVLKGPQVPGQKYHKWTQLCIWGSFSLTAHCICWKY